MHHGGVSCGHGKVSIAVVEERSILDHLEALLHLI